MNGHRNAELRPKGNAKRTGFRFDEDKRWSTPNPTGRDGVFEAYCPPHHADMTAAVEAFRGTVGCLPLRA
jgi:hypothetical protein